MKLKIFSLFNKTPKTKKYLVLIESGKNNIGGCNLHILKMAIIVNAASSDEAITKAREGNHPRHYGHSGDYITIIDIKEIPE